MLSAVVILLVAAAAFMAFRRLLVAASYQQTTTSTKALPPSTLSKKLASALTADVVLLSDNAAFEQQRSSYWAQQACEVIPDCVVRPRDVSQLCTAIKILSREHSLQASQDGPVRPGGLFAIRGGGHSPATGAASIAGGVLIDLSHFCEVTVAEDESSVCVGGGALWGDVYKVLEKRGLAAVGGGNSPVGVGGLTLGGGMSFFSHRFGLVCHNVLSYEIVLASGMAVTASASTNPDLFRALKGGANNFGIVTRFKVRCFPFSKIWSGFLYLPSFQAPKVLAAFHESLNAVSGPAASYDRNAAGPIACFSYIQAIRTQAITVQLAHTDPSVTGNEWPAHWSNSSFSSVWRLWSTCRVRTLTSATNELISLNPAGKRQLLATTTIKNDLATLTSAHSLFVDAISAIRRRNVRGMIWTLVLQHFLPEWAIKDGMDPLGLSNSTLEPLVNVNFTVTWKSGQDDAFVKAMTRQTLEQIDAMAMARKTGHPYRYLNYCAEWQRPLESYGEENLEILRETSTKYDPAGLFQVACAGGFKLFGAK